jgi:hypothetical protein
MSPTTAASRSGTIAIVIALGLLPPLRAQALGEQASDQGAVRLTLDCVDSAHIVFDIANIGMIDTAFRLGSVLGNGRKYTVDDLRLRLRTPDGPVSEWHYRPRDYPVVVGGTVEDWFEALPVRATYRMSATAEDFVPRQAKFPARTQLSLRLTVAPVQPKAGRLVYWSGTLTSNSCTTSP